MKPNYLLSRRLFISIVFLMIFSNTWVAADANLCNSDAQILSQSDSGNKDSQDDSDDSEDEEEDEEPECD